MTAASASTPILSAEDWKKVVGAYKDKVKDELGRPFPQDGRGAAVGRHRRRFGSWMNQRAITYRRLHDIPAEWGTAVNVQAMVFGNMGEDCATGVAFTRNPSTGDNEFYGEYPGQRPGRGRGRRHPHAAISDRSAAQAASAELPSMEEVMPDGVRRSGRRPRTSWKPISRDMQDMEFTVAAGQAVDAADPRPANAPPPAALKIAVDMAAKG